jgi:hypothetical protein
VQIEKPEPVFKQFRSLHADFEVSIFPQQAPLARTWFEPLYIQAQWLHVPDPRTREALPVAVKNRAEVTPAIRPQFVHLLGRLLPAHEMLVFEGLHGANICSGRENCHVEQRFRKYP